MSDLDAKKFEDTKLLQHPLVQKAYEHSARVAAFLIRETPAHDTSVSLDEIRQEFEAAVGDAETLSQLCQNKDPDMIAAALLVVASEVETELRTHKGFRDSIGVLSKIFPPQVLDYIQSSEVLDFQDEDYFLELSDAQRAAGSKICTAQALNKMQDHIAQASAMTPGEMRDIRMQVVEFFQTNTLARQVQDETKKTEPGLVEAFCDTLAALDRAVALKSPAPAPRKNEPKP